MTAPRDTAAVFVYAPRLGEFQFSPDHPFKPERISRVYELCRERGLFSGPHVRVERVEEIEDGVLERFHTAEYIAALKRADRGESVDLDMLHHGIGSQENPVFRGIYEFSALSTTSSLRAARLVLEGAGSAFNPCGGFHHAHPDRASGFCYVNDAVIAIRELIAAGMRVAYVDIDAHHGDAVQEAFYDDASVLTVSMHETGKTLFPWGGFEREIGEGSGTGFNINIPLEPDTDDEIFVYLFTEIVLSALHLFEPDVIVGQFGTDMLATDPLTHLRLTNNGYIEAVESLHRLYPRIVALGGGGYRMEDVIKGWTLVWAELSGIPLDDGYGGAVGGVLLGDSSIEGSDLRDMRHHTTGPVKEALVAGAERLIAHFHDKIRPFLE